MKKVYQINLLNWMRSMKSTVKHILELGMGNDYSTDATKADGGAKVTDTSDYGIAIGHDAYVDADYGIALGNFQKVAKTHGISEGSYFNKVERYGEKRRTFFDDNNKLSRSWFEWYGNVQSAAEPPGPIPTTIFLHGVVNEQVVLADDSALTFNIKVVGTDKNSTPNVCGYHLSGTIKRGSGAVTTAIVGTVQKDSFEDVGTLDFNVVADTVSGALCLQANSHPTNTWYWAATGWVTEYRW